MLCFGCCQQIIILQLQILTCTMKLRPVILLAAAAICIMSYSSCVKKYICHCDITATGFPGLPDSTVKEWEITDSKSNAKTTCEKESGTRTSGDITTTENCYLY